jgi:hypothetical protein
MDRWRLKRQREEIGKHIGKAKVLIIEKILTNFGWGCLKAS